MRLLVVLTIIFCANSCGGVFHSRPSEKVRISSEIRSKTAKKLKNEMGLIPFGFSGTMIHQIKELGLTFQYNQPVDLQQARRMLVRAENIFLNEINSNEKIRPYLIQYPFDSKNVEVMILLQKSDGSKVDQGELTLIVCRGGVLKYEIHNADTHLLSTIHEETFEEAVQRL
jgi:hypothetical protein